MMSRDGSDGSKDGSVMAAGRGGGGSHQHLKKGPWTAAEDAILMEYVKKHGEGNWNAVQRNSGLMRCGKSCRLRWANHLRPNLKKGAFTADEERLIIELHAKFGNKWARMAAQLPGRTDNEIKNYWNTRVKRRQRAGLPIYPHEVQLQQRHIILHQRQATTTPSLSSSQLSKATYSPSNFSFFNATGTPTASSCLPNTNQPFKLYRDNNGGLALSLSPSFSSSALPFNPNSSAYFCGPTPTSLPISGNNFGANPRPSNNFGFFSSLELELPSIQSPLLAPSAPTSSASGGSEYVGATSGEVNNYEIAPEFSKGNSGFSQGNSGLLEDLLEESHALARANKKSNSGNQANDVQVEDSPPSAGQGDAPPEKPKEDSSSPDSSTEKNEIEEINSIDEDLLSLLDNFPMNAPVTDWQEKSNTAASGQSSGLIGGSAENVREASPSLIPATGGPLHHEWRMAGCYWDTMPTIF